MNAGIIWHEHRITQEHRARRNGHAAMVVWLTGLSGAGKSTLAHLAEETLHRAGYQTYVLDGDNIRHGLSKDLGFSIEDRQENMRRVGEAAKLLFDAGMVVFVALVSPLKADRDQIRKSFPEGRFAEVYCKCPLPTCENRDPKGLYRMARSGLVREFTGISSPYEAPTNPELVLDTDRDSIEQSLSKLTEYLYSKLPIDRPPCC